MLVRPPGHRLTHVSRKPRAIASGWVPSGQAPGTQDTVSPREKLVAQQLSCRTETLDLAEALPRPPQTPEEVLPSIGVSQDSDRVFL